MKKITDYYTKFALENSAKGLSEATKVYYDTSLRFFFNFLDSRKIKKPSQITPTVIHNYTTHLQASNIASASVNTYLRAVRRFISFLCKEGVLKPFKVPMPKSQQILKDYFSADEVARIFAGNSVNEQAWTISILLLGTGIRAGSLIGLQVRDIDFDSHAIILRKTKTKKIHILPLTPYLTKNLLQHISVRNLHANDYVFQTSKCTPFTRHTLWRALERFLKAQSIEKTGIHIFRHTFARLMVLNGCDAFTLQKWLTHSSIEQSKQYVTLYANDLAATMCKYNPTAQLEV